MTDTPLRFRNATLDDVEAIVALVDSAYRGDSSRAGWTTEADMFDGRRTGADEIVPWLQRERACILLAERDNSEGAAELIACAQVAVDDGDGYFGMFSVRPTLQGGGIGKRVLAEAERVARDEWRVQCMRMTVFESRRELVDFYQRRGYCRTGIIKPFPYGDARFGVPKREGLRFEVLEKRWI